MSSRKIIVLCAMMTSLICDYAFATLITSAGTGSSGTGGFTSVGGSLIDVNQPLYDQSVTTPASNWVWDNIGSNNLLVEYNFSLAGFDASTAILQGLWGVDNFGSIFLNGTEISSLQTLTNSNFTSLTSFSTGLSSLFLAGNNNLLFLLSDNNNGVAAFRAAFTVNADRVSQVSAPATFPLLLAGAFGLLWKQRRRNRINITSE